MYLLFTVTLAFYGCGTQTTIEDINEMYFDIALKTKKILDKKFGNNYEYSIWHKNGNQLITN